VASVMLASRSAMIATRDSAAATAMRNSPYNITIWRSGLPGAAEQHQAVVGPHRLELRLLPPGCAVPCAARSWLRKQEKELAKKWAKQKKSWQS
jgi:hypothetical protein